MTVEPLRRPVSLPRDLASVVDEARALARADTQSLIDGLEDCAVRAGAIASGPDVYPAGVRALADQANALLGRLRDALSAKMENSR